MLSRLHIHNYILIKDLETSFKDKLTTVTGETGAGKSIILGALGLMLGSRADVGTLLDKEKKCIIEGIFEIGGYDLKDFFEKNDLDWEIEAILRREISPNGKSRAFINDTPVNLNILKELSEKLVDIHSQHQTLRLIAPGFQISLLDANINHKPLLDDYRKLFRKYTKSQKQLSDLKEQEGRSKKEHDYNLFQLTEIDEAKIIEGELQKLEEELSILSHAETIQSNLHHSTFLLSEDEASILNRVRELKKAINTIAGFNPRLQMMADRIDSLLIEGKDLSAEIENFLYSVTVDNSRMELVSERMQVINQLLSKHQMRTDLELLQYAKELRMKVGAVENINEDIMKLEKEQEALLEELSKMAITISGNRKKAAPGLEQNLAKLLNEVGIPEATISIKLEDVEKLNDTGRDRINILFSANKGMRPESINNVASGGELSRLILCIKYILADSAFLPTIIFDEIDTGISGEVAIRVGNMIKQLASRHQVICITHLPQIAAMGDNHFIVYKKTGEDFTQTHIRELSDKERIEEIAKMLAGNKPGASAIESAKEMLAVAYN
jgi:DNA repair protein RecN (Recombination protein N)